MAGYHPSGAGNSLILWAWTALQEAGAAQSEHLAVAEPCGHFLRLLAGTLASGRAHSATPQGNPPPLADAWGWRGTEINTQDGQETHWNPLGRCVGWVDGMDVYLEPEAAYAEVQEMARHQGESLPVGVHTLWKRMDERGLLASRDTVRQRLTVRRRLAGQDRREVIHLRADGLSCTTRPHRPHRPRPHRTPGKLGTVPGTVGTGRVSTVPNHRLRNPEIPAAEASLGTVGTAGTVIVTGSHLLANFFPHRRRGERLRRRWAVHGAILTATSVGRTLALELQSWKSAARNGTLRSAIKAEPAG